MLAEQQEIKETTSLKKTTQYLSLVGKRIFITGGATGIGAALVESFCLQGAHVGFIDIDSESGYRLTKSLSNMSKGELWFRAVDVQKVEDLQGSIEDFHAAVGGLDVLINNVANDTRHDVLEVTEQSWRACMSVNLDSAFFASQTAIKLMKNRAQGTLENALSVYKGGAIINFSSINALTGPSEMPGYVAAKSALLGLTKSLARTYGSDGIRVNSILPGWVVTDRQIEHWLTPEAKEEWMKNTSLQSLILPEDVANLTLFLAADDSRMITNQSFVIDGGHI